MEDRYLPILHLRNRVLPVTTTASTPLEHRVSRPTGSRRLPEHGIRARRPYRAVTLTQLHRRYRLIWARRHRSWRVRGWGQIVFSDESRVCLFRTDGRQRVYRRQGERVARDCVQEGARCCSVVRAFAHGAMGRRIDPSWGGPIELFLVPASDPRLV